MTVIRPNSISGINSITGNGGDISIFRADGTAADVTVNNITSGIITATTFSGNITGATGTFTGNLGVGGVLTYEDVTNVDSVGVITARSGIRLGATGANSIINGNADGIGINTAAASSLGLEVSSPFNDIARITGPNSGNITFRNATANEVILHTGNSDALIFGTNGNNERIRIGTAGQLGIAGANYGTSGQVLTSQGSGSAVQWASIYNERYTVSNITGTSQINVTNLGTDPHEICINFHFLKGVGDPCAILLRLGTSSGLYSSMAYNQTWTYFNNTSSTTLNNSRNHDQNAFWIYNNNFTSPLNIYSGNITLRRTITGTYLLAGSAMSDRNENNNQYSNFTNGRVDISGACTQLRIYVDNGTNFAQGSVTVRTIA